MERITMKQIEERFDRWNKNDVQRIRSYQTNPGKTFVDAENKIIFFNVEGGTLFYKISDGEHFTIQRKTLEYAFWNPE